MRTKPLAGFAALLLFVATLGTAGAASYNATAEFGTASNPNGVWSYGWMPTDFSAFSLYTNKNPGTNPQWYTPGMSGDYTPGIWRNDSTSGANGVAPGQLALHPGPQTQPSALRWTAPSNGNYSIVGQFFAGDWGTMTVGVRKGSDSLWQHTDSGTFDLQNIAIAQGSSIDFVVYGGYGWGSTPLEVTISSPIPEPEIYALMLAGLGFLGLKGRGGKQ